MAAKAEALDRADRRRIATSYLNLDLDCVPDKMIEPKPQPAQNGRYSDALPSLVGDYISSKNRDVDDAAERKKIAKDVKQRGAVLAQFVEAKTSKQPSGQRHARRSVLTKSEDATL
ncbi:MAG: hypothetical protein ABJH20_24305 [Rhizobiaceae bacterium]